MVSEAQTEVPTTTETDWTEILNYTYGFTTGVISSNTTLSGVSLNSSATFPTVQPTISNHNDSTYVNNSLLNTFQNDNPSVLLLEAGFGALVTRSAFLVVFIITGFISTCMLMTTLAQSNRRKPVYLNLFLINILAANLLDCIVNLPLVLGATVTERWDYGDLLCQLNACFFQLTSITTMVGFCALYIDRCIAVKNPTRYYSVLSLPKVNILIIWCWVHGLALSFAPIGGLIKADIFPARYLCSVGKETPLIYACLVPLLGYIIPLLVIIGLSSAIVHISRKQRKRRSLKKNKRQSPKKIMIAESVEKEINTSKFVAVIFTIWMVLEGPYLILNSVEQILKSNVLKSTYASQSFNYPWEMEVVFTWLRMSFPVFLPFVTFAWRRDVWHKFKDLIFCRKSNLIDDQSPSGTPEVRDSITNSYIGGTDTIGRKKGQQAPAFNVPVLYATEKGIHVETLSKRAKTPRSPLSPEHFETEEEVNIPDDMDKTDTTGIVTARKCDVIGSQDLLQIDDDTSDYDSNSETDPFAASNQGLHNRDLDEKSNTARQKSRTSSSSRHNSEVVLISGSQKSFDNEAFITNDDPTPTLKPAGQQKVKSSKERNRDSIGSQSGINETRNDHERSMKHMRSSSDSGRGSEEGTISRREKISRPQIENNDPVVVANVTTNETSTDAYQQIEDADKSPGERSKVKRKKRRKKRMNDQENVGDQRTDNVEHIDNSVHMDLMPMEQVMTRPPIRLKPLAAPPSPNPSSLQPPAHLQKKLPSPYKNARGGTNGRSPKKESSSVQAKESEGVRYHNRSDSDISAIITEPDAPEAIGAVSAAAKPANVAARRRRTNTLTKVVVPDRLAESDITGDIRNRERLGSGDFTNQAQRLTLSDSAADLRRLSQTKDGDGKKSPRPSPRPRKPRRVSDLPKVDPQDDYLSVGSFEIK